ncbi:MAG: conjugal transfer protein TrbH [Betaproteobacteria bacterium]
MRTIAVLALLGLTGCATLPTPTPYGNFADARVEFTAKIAADTVKQLVMLYPPASTQLSLRQATPDAFGTSLVSGLRGTGYGLAESKLEDGAPRTRPTSPSKQAGATVAQQPTGLELRYILDQQASLYRVTVMVGNQSLTRAYVEQNNALLPAGSWVRRE